MPTCRCGRTIRNGPLCRECQLVKRHEREREAERARENSDSDGDDE